MGIRPPLTRTYVVDPRFDEATRRQIGEAIVEYIFRRSKRGQGKDQQPLRGPDGDARYSDSYVNSVEFKAAGKSGRRPNMTLTGDMLTSMAVTNVSARGRVTIGFLDDADNDKAWFMMEKNYNFFELSERELQQILNRFGQTTQTPQIDRGVVNAFLRNIFRG